MHNTIQKILYTTLLLSLGLLYVPQVFSVAGDVQLDVSTGGQIIGSALITNKFTDAANTDYYLDPAASTTSLTVAGNVGIGTTAPNGKLDVRAATDVNLSVRANGTSLYLTTVNDANGANIPIQIESSALYINPNSGGNVGIGTVTPNQKFQVVGNGIFGASGMDPTAYTNGLSITGATNAATSLFLWKNGQTSAQIGFRSAADTNLYLLNSYTTGLISNSPGIAIDTSGNVGIGTTSPASTLHVNGSVRIGNSIEVLEKGGNNGTVTCDTYCQGSGWGGWTGACIVAFKASTKIPTTCGTTDASTGLSCLCARMP